MSLSQNEDRFLGLDDMNNGNGPKDFFWNGVKPFTGFATYHCVPSAETVPKVMWQEYDAQVVSKWAKDRAKSNPRTEPNDSEDSRGNKWKNYRPIKNEYEIRVLELLPGNREDELEGRLRHCSIEFEYPNDRNPNCAWPVNG